MHTPHAIILAAGFGSRLQAQEGHKLLAVVGGRTMLAHHLDGFARLGVTRLTIVTGYRHEALEEAIDAITRSDDRIAISTAYNADFQRSNGLSVLAAIDAVKDPLPFWLTMGDHLFEPLLFERLRHAPPFPEHVQGALYIDRKLDTIFDVPDATKLRFTPEGRLDAIGKEIGPFDVADTGLFWGAQGFVDALRQALESRGDCSTSDAVSRLEAEGAFLFPDVGDALWQDVDTPEARAHAEHLLTTFRREDT